MNTLPDKLSDLIDVALADLEACERDPRYVIDMDVWHAPLVGGRCAVCWAGAVMAQTLRVLIGSITKPSFFDTLTRRKLNALDELRRGYVWAAAGTLGVNEPSTLRHRVVAEYGAAEEEKESPAQLYARLSVLARASGHLDQANRFADRADALTRHEMNTPPNGAGGITQLMPAGYIDWSIVGPGNATSTRVVTVGFDTATNPTQALADEIARDMLATGGVSDSAGLRAQAFRMAERRMAK